MFVVAIANYLVVLLIFILFIIFAAHLLHQPTRLPDDIPWAGGFTTSFGKLLAPYRVLFRGPALMEQAYYKYSKLDRICVMPNIFENRILLPPSYTDWLNRQPPQILTSHGTIAERISPLYTMRRNYTEQKPAFEIFLRRQMNLHLDELTSDLMDEISFSMDQLLGLDTNQYKTVNIARTVKQIVARTVNRILVGQPLCRDLDFIENTIRYVNSVPPVGMLIRLLPSRLTPIIGQKLALVNRFFHLKFASSVSSPLLEEMERWHGNSAVTPDERPNIWISWSVDEAMKREMYTTADKKLRWLARTMSAVHFVSIFTTTISISHLILDVFSAPVWQHCLDDLLKEVETLTKKFGSEWNRARMTEMTTMDSALRESMRLSSPVTTISIRRVVAPDGLVLPDGTWLPCGSLVEMPAYTVHHDESIYPEALEYRHTRFLQTSKDGKSLKSAATSEPTFLNWGYGRHACPGRYLAVDVGKMVMTYLITNYDVIPFPERPKNKWMAGGLMPPLSATMQVRRRPQMVKN